jgi:hypothetical protein
MPEVSKMLHNVYSWLVHWEVLFEETVHGRLAMLGLNFHELRHISKPFSLKSIPFKNAVDVASNGECFTLTNAANLKTYIPSKINKKRNLR